MSETEFKIFFKQKRTVSEIKSEILLSCFKTWLTYYLQVPGSHASSFHYYDLLVGSGSPEENSPAGILSVTQKVSESYPEQNVILNTYFYSSAKGGGDKLKVEWENQQIFSDFFPLPKILQEGSSENECLPDGPSLLVADPFGSRYAQELLIKALQENGSDIWLLFPMNKLFTTALHPEKEESLLSRLFGTGFAELKKNLATENNLRKREQIGINALEKLFQDLNYNSATLRINLPGKDQLQFYLVMASRMKPLYFLFREIIQSYSDCQPDGVPLFKVNQKPQPAELPGLFRYLHPYCMENLLEELAISRSRFHYQTIRDIYEEHAVGTPYSKENYLQAFETLKTKGHVNLVDGKNKQVKLIDETAIVFYKLHRST